MTKSLSKTLFKALLRYTIFLVCLNQTMASVPQGMPTYSSLISELRGTVEAKFREIPKNYIQRVNGNSITYFSNKDVQCAGKTIKSKEELTYISLYSNLSDDGTQLKEVGKFRGCLRDSEITEEFFYKGEELEKNSVKDYLAGKLNLDIFNYDYFRYQIKYSISDMPFLSVEGKRDGDRHFSTIRVYRQKIMQLTTYKRDSENTDYVVTFYPYKIKRLFYGVNVNIDQKSIIIKKRKKDFFYFSNSKQISEFEFSQAFNNIIVNIGLGSLSGIVKFSVSNFPNTQQISASGQNSRLIDELRLAFTQLLNRDLERIRILLLQYIEAAENNLLLDQRPKD